MDRISASYTRQNEWISNNTDTHSTDSKQSRQHFVCLFSLLEHILRTKSRRFITNLQIKRQQKNQSVCRSVKDDAL